MKTKENTGIDFTPMRWFSGNQAGRLDCVSSGQETLKESPKLKGDYQAQVHSGQMVLVAVRQARLDHVNGGQRCSKKSRK
jgi:hypothetical protein